MDKKKSISLPLSLSLFAAFTVANGLIRAPFFRTTLLSFFAALISGIITLPLLTLLFKRVRIKSKTVLTAAFLSASVFLFIAAWLSFGEYCDFVYGAVLTKTDMWLIKSVFAFCVFSLSVSKNSAVYKFAFLSFVLLAGVFSVLFLMSAKTFDFKNLSGAFGLSGFSLSDTGVYFLNLILPSVAAVLFFCMTDSGVSAAGVLCGVSAGAIFCTVAVLDSVLSFGLSLAAKLSYPYIDDISTVTAGSLFTRMDGFAYFTFFACYVLKCAVCIKTAARLLRRAGIKYEKTAVGLLCIASAVFAA